MIDINIDKHHYINTFLLFYFIITFQYYIQTLVSYLWYNKIAYNYLYKYYSNYFI